MTTASTTSDSDDMDIVDPCVAEFLARHGVEGSESLTAEAELLGKATSATNQTPPTQAANDAREAVVVKPAASTAARSSGPTPVSAQPGTVIHPPPPQKPVESIRQLRSVANSISVSISRSNLVRDKIGEAGRFLTLGLVAAVLALTLAFFTTSANTLVFYAALFTLVLGLISTYRSTMIMTKLGRIAKI